MIIDTEVIYDKQKTIIKNKIKFSLLTIENININNCIKKLFIKTYKNIYRLKWMLNIHFSFINKKIIV